MPHSLRAKLGGLRYKGIITDKEYKRLCDALDALKKEPCDDAISREDVMQILWDYDCTNEDALMVKAIKDLPSVQPTRPQGEVINYQEETPNGFQRIKYICSNCGAELKGATRPHGKGIRLESGSYMCSNCNENEFGWNKYDFCPHCGADMRGNNNGKRE